jgi:hypothetical protein
MEGSDDNPGTKTEPLRSISGINRLELKPGDAVFFK